MAEREWDEKLKSTTATCHYQKRKDLGQGKGKPFLYFTANIYDDGGDDAQKEEKERIFSFRKKIETLGKQQHSSTLPITAAAAPKKR